MGNGGKESEGSRWRHWRERPVSHHASQERAGAIEAKGRVWNVKRRENPARFGRQGSLGKGAWPATSKGPRGIPGQFALWALLTAPGPGVDPTRCVGGPQTKAPELPAQPSGGPWGSGARARPVKAHWLPGILVQGLSWERGQGRPLHRTHPPLFT